ncbi:MAG: IS66 family transposase [Bacteroidales bacterium]
MSIPPDNNMLVNELLRERDILYQELSRLREGDNGALAKAEKKNEKYEIIIQEKDQQINKLIDQLSWYRRKFFNSGSERYILQDPNQRRIDFDGLDLLPQEEQHAKEAERELIAYKEKKSEKPRKTPVRTPLSDDYRRQEEVIEPEGIDHNWVRIGQDVIEVLEHTPGEVWVRRIIRPKYALISKMQKDNQDDTQKNVIIAPLPLLPIPRGNAGASMLAELLIGKYMHHLPFHRQIAIFKLAGITLPASTINGWTKDSCDLLRSLYHRLREIVLETDYIQVDESTVPVIDNEKQKAVKAYLWMVRSVEQNLVFFHYDKGSRAQKTVVELLKNYQGAIQTDGYQAYSIYENKKGVLLLGCWAHSRRKFFEALKEDKAGAEYAMGQIKLLYQVEDMATDQNLDHQQRAELRSRLAYPIMCAFEKWIVNYYPKVLPKGRMGKALSYTYNLFQRLTRYHLNGKYRMDNNLIENDIRALALGRKNYMFCGNHEAAENSAVLYSLLGCCKAHDVNPREWLIDVLTRIPAYNKDYSLDLAELLPHNWKISRNSQEIPTKLN